MKAKQEKRGTQKKWQDTKTLRLYTHTHTHTYVYRIGGQSGELQFNKINKGGNTFICDRLKKTNCYR